ncbi:MAG TPA: DegT/DnrJ/EryC1/StrS family aminotransferase [Gaiellaceae bacterium]|nr:DegT/DnrJ/EryC1/StrS family aminotransferase [Gaiellaceae bacterium]
MGSSSQLPATAARERDTQRTGTGPAVPFVDLRSSTDAVRQAVLGDVEALLDANAFVNGPAVESFERELAAACGRRFAIGTASGLDALTIGLRALGLEEGDEVVVPAMTFVATFEAVVHAGGRVVVVDVREDDACMDPAAVAAAVGTRTRFLVPVHLYGQMADMRALGAIAADHGLAILEDACQAHGAERDGLTAGGAGTAAAFSFYPSKNLGAMGDAGALVLDDDAAAAMARSLREHGQTRPYSSDYVGLTSRLDTLQALVLLRKLPLLPRWNAERARAASFYEEALDGVGDLRLPTRVPGAKHVWHVYQVRTCDPEALGAYLAGRGIGTKRHYPEAPHLSTAFADLEYPAGSFPVAEAIARETLSLPLFPGITDEQLEAVADAVADFFARG